MKSTLGFHQYRFRRFEKVERWVDLCLITFLYLEWYRAEKLGRRDMRLSLPEARPTLYLTAALAITIPFNIAFGIPIYYAIARWLYGAP